MGKILLAYGFQAKICHFFRRKINIMKLGQNLDEKLYARAAPETDKKKRKFCSSICNLARTIIRIRTSYMVATFLSRQQRRILYVRTVFEYAKIVKHMVEGFAKVVTFRGAVPCDVLPYTFYVFGVTPNRPTI